MLRISGFRSISDAENGSIGLQMAAQSMPDVIIRDITMPVVLDGCWLRPALRRPQRQRRFR